MVNQNNRSNDNYNETMWFIVNLFCYQIILACDLLFSLF